MFLSDVNECVTGDANCTLNSHCLNTNGSYLCACDDGFLSANGSCTGGIRSLPTGYELVSPLARIARHLQVFTLIMLLLTDINECIISPCSDNCTNTPGGFYCSCPEGFTLDTNGTSCVDSDECEDPAICDVNNSLCTNTVGRLVS